MSIRKLSLVGLAAGSMLALASASQAAVVAYYTFDNAANLGQDSSGNGYTLTAGGGPTALTGAAAKVGTGAVGFDGVDDVLTRSASDIYQSGSAVSLSFWVQTSDTTNANNNKNISRDNSTTGLNVSLAGTTTSTYRAAPTTGTGINSGVNEDSTWRSVVITYSSGTTTMYVDGVQKGTPTTGGTYVAGTGLFGIGARASATAGVGTSGTFFLGNIDDFAVYNTALSATDAANLANGTATPTSLPEPTALAVIGLGGTFALRRRSR